LCFALDVRDAVLFQGFFLLGAVVGGSPCHGLFLLLSRCLARLLLLLLLMLNRVIVTWRGRMGLRIPLLHVVLIHAL